MPKDKVPNVPTGWKAQFDETYQTWFFIDLSTGKSQWEEPKGTTWPGSEKDQSPPPYEPIDDKTKRGQNEPKVQQQSTRQQSYSQQTTQTQQRFQQTYPQAGYSQPQGYYPQQQYPQQYPQPYPQQYPQQQQQQGSSNRFGGMAGGAALGAGAGLLGGLALSSMMTPHFYGPPPGDYYGDQGYYDGPGDYGGGDFGGGDFGGGDFGGGDF